eukprot:5608318-Pyramimonas_sp.AAC.1
MRTLVEGSTEQGPPNWCTPFQRPCSCAFKTALAPAGHHEWRRDLMDFTPFGGPSARDQWPCLGAVVVSRAAEPTGSPARKIATSGSRCL